MGYRLKKEEKVRLQENVTIKARTEQVVLVRSNQDLASLTGDFEPHRIDLRGIYACRARVIPNFTGIFRITLLNITESDIVVKSRKVMGFINPLGSVVNGISTETEPPERRNSLDAVTYGDNLTYSEKSQLQSLIRVFDDIFAADPKNPTLTNLAQHRIITNDALPVKQKPRRLPKAWENEVNQQVKEMLDKQIIRPSQSPWNSPILLVKKRDNTTRFVCDFRALNNVTKKDTYPLPHVRDVIDEMDGSQYWSTFDAAAAYWSIPLAEEDKEKTAFSVPRGKFEFNVTPYGLCNAGSTYQRMIDICLSGLPNDRILAYMDDSSF